MEISAVRAFDDNFAEFATSHPVEFQRETARFAMVHCHRNPKIGNAEASSPTE